MRISTDEAIIFQNNIVTINNTLIYSWLVMFILISIAYIIKKSLVFDVKNSKSITGIQICFESIITLVESQIKQVSSRGVETVFPFIASLFLYIVVSNLLSLIPMMESPTGSFSTTLALAISVFIFSMIYGFKEKGYGYFDKFLKPIPFLLPLNIVSELSKVLSLSIRLYGNIMSSGVIITILTGIVFLSVGFPILINLLSTITGVIQAYIFSILSMIFISVDD